MSSGDRGGASALEVIFILLILAVLALIAYPRVKGLVGGGAAGSVALQRDLERIAAAEEAYFAEHRTYVADTAQLRGATVSAGTLVTFGPATATGWSASAVNTTTAPGLTCAVFYGAAPPLPPATVAGQVACR